MKNTILIVEDEGSLSGYLTKELQFEDFNVLVAANGLAAMETYQAHQNELLLILLDWMLPKLDGNGSSSPHSQTRSSTSHYYDR